MNSIILTNPIELIKKSADGETREFIHEISVKREPNCGDFFNIKVNSITIGDVLQVFANCTDLPINIVKKMHARDMRAAQEWVMGFLD